MDNPLVQPDPGLFIWTILTFLVLVALLAKFAWKPLLERVSHESAQIIGQARVEADQIISMSRGDAERLREEMRQKARAEADGIVKNAERQIQLETARALQQIRHEAADLSVAIASKLIQRNLTKEDNEELVDEALKQLQ